MIVLKMITKTEDILAETGLPDRNSLWDAGFDLDDWDMCFVSDIRLVEPFDDNIDENDYDLYDADPIEEAYWLIRQMEGYCCGYKEIEYCGKWYYMVYHA